MIKQVIVVRSDLRNTKGAKLHAGKLIAQGAHASMAWLTTRLRDYLKSKDPEDLSLSLEELEWIQGDFTKVVLKVNSCDEMFTIRDNAMRKGIEAHLIVDKGLTEFGGVLTPTCIGIGPDKSELIDPITGHLSLF